MWRFLIPIAHAQDPVVVPGAPSLIPQCARQKYGADQLSCGIELFVNISQILLGLVGALMLILFVYGGILFLFSQGGPNVQKATGILRGTLVGLLIVFGAYTGVTWATNALRGGSGNVPDVGNYVTCSQAVDEEGKPPIAINDDKPCGPGFVCSNGACIDRVNPDQ